MNTDFTKIGYDISQIIHSMTDKDARPQDIQAATGIILHARNMWLEEGLAAASTFFDPRVSKEDSKEDAESETSLFEQVDLDANDLEDDEENGSVEADEDALTNEEQIVEEGNQLIIEAFKTIEVNAELLATQSFWVPLTDALDRFFTMLNNLEIMEPNDTVDRPKMMYAELADILRVNVFSKDGLILIWEEIYSAFQSHLNK